MFGKIRDRLQRPIKQKFNDALPTRSGDRMLLALLGKMAGVQGVAEKMYSEAEVFLIKGGLFSSGVRIDESAYAGVGTIWKEDQGQLHYNPNADLRQARTVPHALILPHDIYMQIYLDPASPFVVRREGAGLYLYLENFRLFPVEYEKRPHYYKRETSTGVPMGRIGAHRLRRQLLIEYSTFCRFFGNKTECLYCGIASEKPSHNAHYGKYFASTPEEIAEVAGAAYDGPMAVSEMQITGGVMPNQEEFEYVLEVGHAVKERLGKKIIPGSQAVVVPPQKLHDMDKLKEAGWQGVSFNIEIWDERLWPGIVPGKAETLARARWIESLLYAVELFGKGNVASVLVAGLEPKRSHWEGVEWLAEHDIYGVPIPWTPAPGSPLEGHQSPTAAWHLEVTARDLDFWEAAGLSAHRHSSGGLHYDDMANMREHLAEVRQRDPSYDVTSDLRHTIAVQGKMPSI